MIAIITHTHNTQNSSVRWLWLCSSVSASQAFVMHLVGVCVCSFSFPNSHRKSLSAREREREPSQNPIYLESFRKHTWFLTLCVCVCVLCIYSYERTFNFWLITSYLTCSGWKSTADTIVFSIARHSQVTMQLNKFHIESPRLVIGGKIWRHPIRIEGKRMRMARWCMSYSHSRQSSGWYTCQLWTCYRSKCVSHAAIIIHAYPHPSTSMHVHQNAEGERVKSILQTSMC